MQALLRSRKFLLLALDAIFGIAALGVAFFLVSNVELQVFIAAIFALLQPVFVGAIMAIAKEDAAALAMGVHPNQVGGPR